MEAENETEDQSGGGEKLRRPALQLGGGERRCVERVTFSQWGGGSLFQEKADMRVHPFPPQPPFSCPAFSQHCLRGAPRRERAELPAAPPPPQRSLTRLPRLFTIVPPARSLAHTLPTANVKRAPIASRPPGRQLI